MDLFFPKLIEDGEGVFQPAPPLWLLLASFAAALAAALMAGGRGGQWMGLGAALGLALGFCIRSALDRRLHGPRGRPLVRLVDGQLRMRQVGRVGHEMSVPLDRLAHLVVYGPHGQRRFRFVQADGKWVEANPQWRPVEQGRVMGFLRGALGERVVEEDPQGFFEQARGDGPFFRN